jgi:hypothetical protein
LSAYNFVRSFFEETVSAALSAGLRGCSIVFTAPDWRIAAQGWSTSLAPEHCADPAASNLSESEAEVSDADSAKVSTEQRYRWYAAQM